MTPPAWVWILPHVALAAHAEQLSEHGGGGGLRDPGALDSAMARPRNLALYGDPDAAALAAAYAFGIARNHPFVDGNKRTAAVVSETFLSLNGMVLTASDAELVVAMVALAAGELTEADIADWFREHAMPGRSMTGKHDTGRTA
ncbi:type II toxin-antitoxin system death-on-curing family toxin [Novosphingobium lentum]|uniref:type II toxin-antitoxin system death-on-curing family toxin n=1 Tax=Novosphingobium lentum TaxID=145287 RepID=UPI0008375F09|nr:type II toxin-antitoxin system death-on-curing family toxin [Novosphingobium lentum]